MNNAFAFIFIKYVLTHNGKNHYFLVKDFIEITFPDPSHQEKKSFYVQLINRKWKILHQKSLKYPLLREK